MRWLISIIVATLGCEGEQSVDLASTSATVTPVVVSQRGQWQSERRFADEPMLRDTSVTPVHLELSETAVPVALEPPSTPNARCTLIDESPLLCGSTHPKRYLCPQSAQPIGCSRVAALEPGGRKQMCCP